MVVQKKLLAKLLRQFDFDEAGHELPLIKVDTGYDQVTGYVSPKLAAILEEIREEVEAADGQA